MEETRANTEDRVKKVIMKVLKLDVDARKLERDAPLIGKGLGLDSVSILELVVGLEEEFGIYFDDSDLSVETFQNIVSLMNHVNEKISNKKA